MPDGGIAIEGDGFVGGFAYPTAYGQSSPSQLSSGLCKSGEAANPAAL